ncbi:MAG: hypothetical protein M3Q10_10440, partial [Chloroflexota bacterium]|nr:hypothetical protein [Chloroflexota bacterium]
METTATVPVQTRRLPLLALLAVNAVSTVGSMLTVVALPWFVLETTGSAARAGTPVGSRANVGGVRGAWVSSTVPSSLPSRSRPIRVGCKKAASGWHPSCRARRSRDRSAGRFAAGGGGRGGTRGADAGAGERADPPGGGRAWR